MIDTLMIDAPDSKMELILGVPDGAGPFPTLVVCHHRWGLHKFTPAVIERLNYNGFIAAAKPFFYHRRPADEDTGELI